MEWKPEQGIKCGAWQGAALGEGQCSGGPRCDHLLQHGLGHRPGVGVALLEGQLSRAGALNLMDGHLSSSDAQQLQLHWA